MGGRGAALQPSLLPLALPLRLALDLHLPPPLHLALPQASTGASCRPAMQVPLLHLPLALPQASTTPPIQVPLLHLRMHCLLHRMGVLRVLRLLPAAHAPARQQLHPPLTLPLLPQTPATLPLLSPSPSPSSGGGSAGPLSVTLVGVGVVGRSEVGAAVDDHVQALPLGQAGDRYLVVGAERTRE